MELDAALKIGISKLNVISIIDDEIPIEEFLKTSFEKNPDINSALKNKKAVARQSLSNISAFLPTIDIYFDHSGTCAEWSDLFSVTTLGFDANYTIGEGLGLNAVSRNLEAKALLEKAELEYKIEVQKIEKALRLAFLNYQKSKSLLYASEKEYHASTLRGSQKKTIKSQQKELLSYWNHRKRCLWRGQAVS